MAQNQPLAIIGLRLHASSSLAVAGLFVSTAAILLQPEFLLTASLEKPHTQTISILLRAALALLIPLTFFLNMLWLLTHVAVTIHAYCGATPVPLAFVMRVLHRAAPTLSVVTGLLLSLPLLMHAHMVLAEESLVGAGTSLICLALVMVISFFLSKKLLIVIRRRGSAPAVFSLCTSVGFLMSSVLFSSFSHKTSDDLFTHTPIHFLSLFLIPITFMLGITSLILYVSAYRVPGGEQQAAIIGTENFATIVLAAAFATLLVGSYALIYAVVASYAADG